MSARRRRARREDKTVSEYIGKHRHGAYRVVIAEHSVTGSARVVRVGA